MEQTVKYNSYLYTTESMCDEEITEMEAVENAATLDEFLSSVETWNEEKITALLCKRNHDGLTAEVKSRLYDAYYDLCYFRSMEESEFLKRFNLSKEQIGKLLM